MQFRFLMRLCCPGYKLLEQPHFCNIFIQTSIEKYVQTALYRYYRWSCVCISNHGIQKTHVFMYLPVQLFLVLIENIMHVVCSLTIFDIFKTCHLYCSFVQECNNVTAKAELLLCCLSTGYTGNNHAALKQNGCSLFSFIHFAYFTVKFIYYYLLKQFTVKDRFSFRIVHI